MYLSIFEFLQSMGLKVPLAFQYNSSRMILAAATSMLLVVLLGKTVILKLYQWKMGQPIRQEDCPLLGQLHEKKKDTPTMGGVLILFAIFLSMLVWSDLKESSSWVLMASLFVLGGCGAFDDYLKLRHRSHEGLWGRYKLLVQCAFALGLSYYMLQEPIENEAIRSIYLPFFKHPVLVLTGWSVVLLVPFFIFIIAGTSNAVNLTDGLDGLASGLLIMAAIPLAAIAFLSSNVEMVRYLQLFSIEGAGEVAIGLSALMGGCLGFLWFNGYPAQIFMGDTGSLGLGGFLACAAILIRREFLLGLCGALFVAETLSVILQVLSFRFFNKKRIFLCAPLHHHYEYQGIPETKVVMRMWIVGLLFSLLGLVSIKLQ